MIKIKKYREQRVSLFDNKNKKIGTVNEKEFIDCLCQIVEQELTGYYIRYKRKRININKLGQLAYWPVDLFNCNSLYLRLMKSRKNITKKDNNDYLIELLENPT